MNMYASAVFAREDVFVLMLVYMWLTIIFFTIGVTTMLHAL